MIRSFTFSATLCLLAILSSCSNTKQVANSRASSPEYPTAAREFRAAWVATVANINWPSKPGLSTEEQKQEAINLLDFLQKHHFNAVVFQVRPQADALYKSELEPWSYYLTGQQGKAPSPYYDPLEFWVEAAHERGMELHVWLNPYRAHHVSGKEVSDQSIVKTNPELVVKLKEGYYWMDPAQQGTQDRTTDVVMDLVKRYDIDGVHFDDYFYPYPSYNGNEDFPDHASWAAYQAGGGKLSRGDWRRESVNKLIERLYTSIKAEKPHVKFGLSPFGIWRPGYPKSVEGFDQHEQLFADARLWWNKGWVDYFSPQLYWPINRIGQSYPVLLGWWNEENTKKRHLWPGISVGRDTSLNTVNETVNQIMITRGMMPENMGVVHWNIHSVIKNPKLAETLIKGAYRKKALVPTSPWLDAVAPVAPAVTTSVQGDKLQVAWTPKDANDVFKFVVYYQYGSTWNYEILNSKARSFELNRSLTVRNAATPLTKVMVTAVDRIGNESISQVVSIGNGEMAKSE